MVYMHGFLRKSNFRMNVEFYPTENTPFGKYTLCLTTPLVIKSNKTSIWKVSNVKSEAGDVYADSAYI